MKIWRIVHETTNDDWDTISQEKQSWACDSGMSFYDVAEKVKADDVGFDHCRRLIAIYEHDNICQTHTNKE